ncbi:MAG: alkaline phosphatase family protein [Muribaculaceae bacterium]|nr:alkaline phosphatase family protein [Muribaculaceae bacterium]
MNRFLAPLILLIFSTSMQSQERSADMPKLVVGITIDQLRTDYIDMMQHLFGEGGFKRLIKDGAIYENIDYGFNDITRASSAATIHTGTHPSTHSITSVTRFNKEKKEEYPILSDKNQLGNFTSEKLSPRKIAVSTIADELKSASSGESKIYSVAPTSEVAIISGGHAANAVFWVSDENGKWATSTYYKEVPPFITEHNIKNGIDSRINKLVWSPLLPLSSYDGIPYNKPDFSFKYFFSEDGEKYKNLKRSALINTEVTSIACTIIDKARLGKNRVPDMLNIGYYAGNYKELNVRDYGVEIQDIYVRLDKELETLLKHIDSAVGLNNTFIFITSTGYSKTEARPYGLYGVPTGEFYPRRATALLNYYLMAMYGHEDWVLGYHDKEIYLNRELIKKKELDYEEFVVNSAEFLSQMEGVQDALTSYQILHGDIVAVAPQRRRYNRQYSGDIVLEIKPGWEINYEDKKKENEYVQYNAVPSPLIFIGKDVTPMRVLSPIDATAVAPTVCRAIRIRAPSASKSYPIILKKQ